jgi:hypothetical protein
MVKKEGIAIAGTFGMAEFLEVMSKEGGIISPDFLNALGGLDFKLLVLIGVFLYVFRERKTPSGKYICPYAKKTASPAPPQD